MNMKNVYLLMLCMFAGQAAVAGGFKIRNTTDKRQVVTIDHVWQVDVPSTTEVWSPFLRRWLPVAGPLVKVDKKLTEQVAIEPGKDYEFGKLLVAFVVKLEADPKEYAIMDLDSNQLIADTDIGFTTVNVPWDANVHRQFAIIKRHQ